MKKIILLALAALMMVGCDMKQTTENIEAPFGGDITNTPYQTILIDSCEYITGAHSLAHKGNFRFCKERRQKKLEELVIKLKEKYQ